jgi:hypothetical protein
MVLSIISSMNIALVAFNFAGSGFFYETRGLYIIIYKASVKPKLQIQICLFYKRREEK